MFVEGHVVLPSPVRMCGYHVRSRGHECGDRVRCDIGGKGMGVEYRPAVMGLQHPVATIPLPISQAPFALHSGPVAENPEKGKLRVENPSTFSGRFSGFQPPGRLQWALCSCKLH